jgi:hypothetical protein
MVQRILVVAAGADPEAAPLPAEQTGQRQEGQGRIAHFPGTGRGAPGEGAERDAADVIPALMSPEGYLLLVSDRAWSPDRHQRWLGEALVEQLLPP